MDKTEVIRRIQEHDAEIKQRFNARSLSIFGSAARDELRSDSDIDVLVEFDAPHTFDRFFGLKSYLEDLLGHSVDLVTQPMLKPRLERSISSELVHVT
jgi:hypothetical protein